MIVAQSTAFSTEFYSALGALTGFTTHQVSVHISNFEAQFLPANTVGFFSRPAPLQSKSSVKGRGKTAINGPASIMQRPGYESSLKIPSEIEQRY